MVLRVHLPWSRYALSTDIGTSSSFDLLPTPEWRPGARLGSRQLSAAAPVLRPASKPRSRGSQGTMGLQQRMLGLSAAVAIGAFGVASLFFLLRRRLRSWWIRPSELAARRKRFRRLAAKGRGSPERLQSKQLTYSISVRLLGTDLDDFGLACSLPNHLAVKVWHDLLKMVTGADTIWIYISHNISYIFIYHYHMIICIYYIYILYYSL